MLRSLYSRGVCSGIVVVVDGCGIKTSTTRWTTIFSSKLHSMTNNKINHHDQSKTLSQMINKSKTDRHHHNSNNLRMMITKRSFSFTKIFKSNEPPIRSSSSDSAGSMDITAADAASDTNTTITPLFSSLTKMLENRLKTTSASSFRRTKDFGIGDSPSMKPFVFFEKPYKYTVRVKATRNNTHISIATTQGKCLSTVSAGCVGLKKFHRGSSDAGYQVALKVMTTIDEKYRLSNPTVHVILSGFGPGREQALKALSSANWNIKRITDDTPIRFGGCRPRKKRRL